MTLPVTLAVEASQFLGLKEKRNKQAGYSAWEKDPQDQVITP